MSEKGIQDEMLLRFLFNASSTGCSWEAMTRTLSLSKEKILARCEILKSLGYHIQLDLDQPVRLIEAPDRLYPDDLRARMALDDLRKGNIGRQIIVYDRTGSTSDVVKALAEEDVPEGVVVFAEEQTAGRGRYGRPWQSVPGKGLWFSILLSPELPPREYSQYTLWAVVSVVEAIEASTGLQIDIKWPNDIYCGSKKCGGILLEPRRNRRGEPRLVLGIGLNVNIRESEFAEQIRPHATSLRLQAGREIHRPTLASAVMTRLNIRRPDLKEGKQAALLEEWMKRDCILGKQIRVAWRDGRTFTGLANRLGEDGSLWIRHDNGMFESVTAGEVTVEKM